MNILVIDVGTSSMRGILMTHRGRVLTMKQVVYQPLYQEGGRAEQDPSDWRNALYEIMRDIMRRANMSKWAVEAVSLTSQRSSVIPVDDQMEPLCKAIMWQDKRTADICEEFASLDDEFISRCGTIANPMFSGSKMCWIRRNRPEIYRKTYRFLVVADYLIWLMTGELATDYTYGSRSNLMNLHTHEWDNVLLKRFGVEKDRLCPLVEPGSICGITTKAFHEICGCPEGIPVITAGGDQQCGAIGQGVTSAGKLSVTLGTGGFIIMATNQTPSDLSRDVICNDSSIPGGYVLEYSILTCCSAFNWFRREFYSGENYDEINAIVSSIPPGANGCICLPYFQGRSTPDWNHGARAAFANVSLATTKDDMLRSLLEGIFYEVSNGIDIMERYQEISNICINGGLTKSEIFNQMQSDVYGRRITRRGDVDATARGALMVAAVRMGLYPNVEEAFLQICRGDDVRGYLPNQRNRQLYLGYRERMNHLYSALQQA